MVIFLCRDAQYVDGRLVNFSSWSKRSLWGNQPRGI